MFIIGYETTMMHFETLFPTNLNNFFRGISVGLYPAMSSDDICRVCIDSKADLILVENEALLKRILLVQHKLPQLKAIVQLRGDPPLSDKRRLYKSHKVRELQIKLNKPFLTIYRKTT